ncbi:hypothetical protein EVAR_71572_1 [Eumeta japonica]|uniref:Uncharacterized protein n=1 Tax=Eumeta variegata TaxID=151549 RepID=A0A4C1TP41_EUMVA|nr:hypothetical protein EVAR_71572_1 [Eumeta japonica]
MLRWRTCCIQIHVLLSCCKGPPPPAPLEPIVPVAEMWVEVSIKGPPAAAAPKWPGNCELPQRLLLKIVIDLNDQVNGMVRIDQPERVAFAMN